MGAKSPSKKKKKKKFNSALQIKDKTEFIKSLTEDMPEAPDHFSRCSDINRRGPALISDLPQMLELSPKQFHERVQESNISILDARCYHGFAGQHIPGAWHLDISGNFPTFAGWVLPTDRDILLVADHYQTAIQASTWARRVGMDRIVGYLDGGMVAWAVSGLNTDSIRLISAEELHDRITGDNSFVLLDVRGKLEYEDNHIKGAVNIPVADLRTRHLELDKNKAIVVLCSSGNRSSLGASILKQHGFKHVINVAGGMSGYSAAGYTRECRVCLNPHGSRFVSNLSDVKKHWDAE